MKKNRQYLKKQSISDRKPSGTAGGTQIRRLGNGGAMINSRGTVVMIDPVLSGFDMPLLIKIPIMESQVPHLNGILLTHCDNDHYSRKTCRELESVTDNFYATEYVAGLLKEELNISGKGYDIEESFEVGKLKVTLTPDGSIWAVDDSRLMEEQLHMPVPDVILFDFSDSRWHIGLEGRSSWQPPIR